ncbi:hypothetical protein TNCV_173181 [Trichonephila clavipes]|nr:hypothetical protein TNCV_173181 [Trichonephila clavipes]
MEKGSVTPVVSRSFEHHIGDSTIWLGFTPILRDDIWGRSWASHLSSPSTNLTRGLAVRRLLIVPPHREGTIHLQTSVPSPGFEPRPYATAVSVANHYTGWATGYSATQGFDDRPRHFEPWPSDEDDT